VGDQIQFQGGGVDWKAVREKAGPYPPEAYLFVREGLAHTVELIHGEHAGAEGEATQPTQAQHVNGQQLCMGLRDFAIRRYGQLARTVLGRWGIRRTDDFGKIVFAMIDLGLMRKSDEDSLDDFREVYDFDEAFNPAESN
jgi:uncharacterized repeat protein (TIGR04138 family)